MSRPDPLCLARTRNFMSDLVCTLGLQPKNLLKNL